MCSIVCFYISFACHSHGIHVCSYATRTSVQFNFIFYVIRMCSDVTCMPFVCHSYVLVYFYVTRTSSVCHLYITRMSLVYYSYVPLCHPRISLVCVRMSPVSYSYVLVCHPYIICMYLYVIRISLVRGFTMNPFFFILLQMTGLC